MSQNHGSFSSGVKNVLFSAVLLGLIVSPAMAAQTDQFAVGLGIHFATGDYGTETDTDSYRIPISLYYYPTERLDFELTVPFIHQNNSNTLISGGTRFDFGGRRGMPGPGPGGTSDTTDSESGLGDISLTAGYLLVKADESLPSIRPLLYLKFPTADEDKGLGTGEFDIGAGVGVAKWFGRYYTFAETRYIFQGDSEKFDLDDYLTLEGKVGYRVNERFLPSVSLWHATAPSEASSGITEARLNGIYWMADDLALEGYVGTGLSSEAADLGVGFSVTRSF